jgi:ferrochelatase
VRPFLANVLRGRRVPPHRIEEVAANYELFGGVSPLTEITLRQAAGLRDRLTRAGVNLPVYVGMRNWHPYLADTLREMSRAGVRHAIGFIAAGHHSYSSCQQYKENVRDARRQIVEEGLKDVQVTYGPSWFEHPLFVETIYRHTSQALETLPGPLRPTAGIVFTAHSLPLSLARTCAYEQQLRTTCQAVMDRLARTDWTLVFQSRSGLPTDPWLEPDIRDYLRAAREQGLQAAVVVPVGFICDHIEVLIDLDTQAAALCREIGLPMVRAATAGDDPLFIDMMADVCLGTYRRFQKYPPLPIAARA